MTPERLIMTNQQEFHEPPHIAKPNQNEVGFGMDIKELGESMAQVFLAETGEKRNNLFQLSDDQAHLKLTKIGREKAKATFTLLQQSLAPIEVSQKAQIINSFDFSESGLTEKESDILKRSLRARLLVSEARKMAPEANPWQTVVQLKRKQLATDEKEISAFVAFDRAIAQKTEQANVKLAEQLGKEKAQETENKWQDFLKFDWLKKPGEKVNRRLVLQGLGVTGLTTAICLLFKGEPRPVKPIQIISKVETKPGERIPRRAFTRKIFPQTNPTLVPTTTPVSKEVAEKPSSTLQPRVGPQKIEPTRAVKSAEQPITKAVPRVQARPEPESKEETRPEPVEILPGGKLTILSPTGAFEPQEMSIISEGDFLLGEKKRKTFDDYLKVASMGQLYFGTGKGLITTLSLDSGHFSGKPLPGQILLEHLKPADKIEILNEKGQKLKLEFIGKTKPISDFKNTIDSPKEAVDQEFPQATQDRNNGENQLYIITCNPQSWSKGQYLNSLVLAFRPAKEIPVQVASAFLR